MPSYPDDRTMLTLASLAVSSRGRYSPDGGQYATVEVSEHQRVEWEIRPAELDELERLGWVELLPPRDDAPPDQAELRVTAKGDYWLTRWLKANRRRVPQLLMAFTPGRRSDLPVEVVSYAGGAA